MSSVTLNGNTYTDDSNATTGMANGGHRVRFVPCLSDFITEAFARQTAISASQADALASKNAAATSATNAATSATNAANQVTLATTQAGNASTSAGTATTQAGIATTKASDANNSAIAAAASALTVATKQDALVSGTNIKTVRGVSLLGSGDVIPNRMGEITYSALPLPAPDFIPCDGSAYVSASYPALFNSLCSNNGVPPDKLANPSPGSSGTVVALSPDAIYLAASVNATPFVKIYKRVADVYTAVADVATPPTGVITSANFSSDGMYLAVSMAVTPFIHIYQRSGDIFTKIPNPTTLPEGVTNCVAFSPTGGYVAVALAVTPWAALYTLSGTTLTRVSTFPSINTAQTVVKFSPDDTYALTLGGNGCMLYSRAGSVMTWRSQEASSSWACADFSPDGINVALGYSSGSLRILRRTGSTFPLVASGIGPISSISGLAYSQDGKALYMGGSVSSTRYFVKAIVLTDTSYLFQSAVPSGETYNSQVSKLCTGSSGGDCYIAAINGNVWVYKYGPGQANFRMPTVPSIGADSEVKGYIKS